MKNQPQTVVGWAARKADKRATREKLIQDCVGDDQEARHCLLCGEYVTADNLAGADQDGNLYCNAGNHTQRRPTWREINDAFWRDAARRLDQAILEGVGRVTFKGRK